MIPYILYAERFFCRHIQTIYRDVSQKSRHSARLRTSSTDLARFFGKKKSRRHIYIYMKSSERSVIIFETCFNFTDDC